MKKGIWITLIVIVLLLIGGGIIYFIFSNKNIAGDNAYLKEVKENPVSLDLAQSGASSKIQDYYPGFNWILIGNIPAYDIYGDLEAHVFIFREDSYSSLNSLSDLEQHVKLFPEESTSEETGKKYLLNDISTVITSAWKEDKLILRHFRGIPEFLAKKQNIKYFIEANNNKNTIGRLIMITPINFGYEIIDKNSKATGETVSVAGDEFKFNSISDLIKKDEDRLKRTCEGWSDEQCRQYKGALIEAQNAHITEWDGFE